MIRTIGGALVGYLTMAIGVMASQAIAWSVLDRDAVFRDGTLEVTGTWVAVTLASGFAVALAGGWIAAQVGGRSSAAHLLAAFVLAMGLVTAFAEIRGGGAEVESEGLQVEPESFIEAASVAEQPGWMLVVLPLIGVAGVAIGGVKRRS